MPAPFFTTNEGEVSRLEGLYIMERNPPGIISGVFLGNVGVAGETVRGPTDVPTDVGSEAEFVSVFGGRDQGSGGSIVNKVWLSLLNKPFGRVTVNRSAASSLLTPAAPVITNHGVSGSTTHTYKVVAKNGTGHSVASQA